MVDDRVEKVPEEQSNQLRELWPRIRGRVTVYALAKLNGVKATGMRSGHMSVQDSVHDLINGAWVRALNQTPPWDSTRKTALEYFATLIDEEARQERRRSGRRGSLLSLVADSHEVNGEFYSHVARAPCPASNADELTRILDLCRWLDRQSPGLSDDAIAFARGVPIAGSTDRIKKRRAKLKKLTAQWELQDNPIRARAMENWKNDR